MYQVHYITALTWTFSASSQGGKAIALEIDSISLEVKKENYYRNTVQVNYY